MAAYVHGRYSARARQSGLHGEPELPVEVCEWRVQVGSDMVPAAVTYSDDGAAVDIGGRNLAFRSEWTLGDPVVHASFNNGDTTFQVDRIGTAYRITHRGVEADIRVLTIRTSELAGLMPEKEPPDLSKFVLSPMPGLLVSLAVQEGAQVRAGEEVAVVEAMKMENVLRASADGIVKTLHATPGDSLSVDQAIVEFE